ncbi:hypothetical protein D3C74_134980 [compost metagenome]
MEVEKRVVLLMLRDKLSEEERSELVDLLWTHMNWSQVLGYIHSHRIGGIVYKNLQKNVVSQGFERFLLNKFYFSLRDQYRLQKVRGEEQLAFTLNIGKQLDKNNIPFCVLKGLTLSVGIYKDFGCRNSNDTDILVQPEYLQSALQVFKNNNYIQGRMSKSTGQIVPANRREVLMRPLVSHEVIPLQKLANGNQFIDYHEIDLQFSIDLMTSNRTDGFVKELIDRKIALDGHHGLYALSWEDHLLFLCNHFYKEATTDYDVVRYNDLSLYKLHDIYSLLVSNIPIQWERIYDGIENYRLRKAAYYTFYYINTVYGSVISDTMMSEIYSGNLEYLHEVYVYNNEDLAIRWEDDVIDRIFNMNRAKNVHDDRFSVPH